jgi:hypothetical protein
VSARLNGSNDNIPARRQTTRERQPTRRTTPAAGPPRRAPNMLQGESDGASEDEFPSSPGAGAKGCACIRDVRAELDRRLRADVRTPSSTAAATKSTSESAHDSPKQNETYHGDLDWRWERQQQAAGGRGGGGSGNTMRSERTCDDGRDRAISGHAVKRRPDAFPAPRTTVKCTVRSEFLAGIFGFKFQIPFRGTILLPLRLSAPSSSASMR